MPLSYRVAVLVTTVGIAGAQVDRHEAGLRLRTFEQRLATVTDEASRSAAFAALNQAVQAFFRLDGPGVARAITEAEAALGPPRLPEAQFAASLQLQLRQRLQDPSQRLSFEVAATFPAERPAGRFVVGVRLAGDREDRTTLELGETLPQGGTLDLTDCAPGDRTLVWTVRSQEREWLVREQGLSLAQNLAERLAKVLAAAGRRDLQPTSIEAGTLDLMAGMLTGMTRERAEETVLPGARLLADAEALAGVATPAPTSNEPPPPFYGPARTGQHWLRIPVGGSSVVLRALVPPPADAPPPLVIALHGMGGSENLFFDGYGNGAIVAECARRGWFLVAPRLGLGTLDAGGLVDALAARWRIDTTRVLVVGHSMGAGQALAIAARMPQRLAAVAALGGGGTTPRGPEAAKLPFFVGIGERDFARDSALRLHRALVQAGWSSALHEYPAVEHLAIVQVALPDVFAFFDRAIARK